MLYFAGFLQTRFHFLKSFPCKHIIDQLRLMLKKNFVFDKDVATRVIACELNLEETPVSKVMTMNPVFVLSDTLAVEALQKMIQGL